MTADLDLLRRHCPALRYDAQEPYRAISAASMTDHQGNLLVLRDGTVLARAGREGDARLRLGLLEAYPPGFWAQKGDRLDAAADELAAAAQYQGDADYANRAYGRVMPEDGGLKWLQYWLWFYYNPKNLLGFGKHEGDWEMVQVGLDHAERPQKVTLSQHERGEAREWSKVERLAGDSDSDSDSDSEHPVIYVAPLSHANYFEAGAHPYPGGIDNPDGSLDPVLPAVDVLGKWQAWPGRWGNSAGVLQPLSRGKLGGVSPASPAHQGTRWTHPAQYHREAEQVGFLRKLGRLARQLGKPTYPKVRSLSASLDGQRLQVSYELDRAAFRSASQLYVTVHDASDPEVLLLSSALPISDRSGKVALLLPEPIGECVVRASAFNAARQRSDPRSTTARTAPA
jgi:hypothetical protein